MVDIDSGTSLGFGFVCYVDPLHAAKAIEAMHGKKLNASCPRAMTVSLARNEGTVSAIESERVYIRNVPVNMRDHDVRQVFCQYGVIFECKIHRAPSTHAGTEGISKGVAFVIYRTVEEARVAVLQAHGTRPFPSPDWGHVKPIMVR